MPRVRAKNELCVFKLALFRLQALSYASQSSQNIREIVVIAVQQYMTAVYEETRRSKTKFPCLIDCVCCCREAPSPSLDWRWSWWLVLLVLVGESNECSLDRRHGIA